MKASGISLILCTDIEQPPNPPMHISVNIRPASYPPGTFIPQSITLPPFFSSNAFIFNSSDQSIISSAISIDFSLTLNKTIHHRVVQVVIKQNRLIRFLNFDFPTLIFNDYSSYYI